MARIGADRGLLLGVRLVDIAVDEVMNDIDRASYAEVSLGNLLEIARNAGDAVALLNGVAGDR